MDKIRKHRIPPILLKRAREMRRESAPAEAILWQCLRDRQLGGYKFRRQKRADSYIADFVCMECRLVVELDGDSHEDRTEYDAARTRRLSELRYEVIRFPNTDVFESLDALLEAVHEACTRIQASRSSGGSPSPSPPPPKRGGGKRNQHYSSPHLQPP